MYSIDTNKVTQVTFKERQVIYMKKSVKICSIIAATLVSVSSIGYVVYASQTNDSTTYIGEEKAKQHALAHAGLKETDVSFVTVNLDKEFNSAEYDVEFYTGNKEYDYEINAINGKVITSDFDIENGKYTSENVVDDDTTTGPTVQEENATTPPKDTTYIDIATAKSTALTHANVSENDVFDLSSDFDYENGKAVYEIDFQKDRNEYEYKIDAITGTILYSNIDLDD